MSRYKKINIEEIPSGNFEGYYWFSDSPKPEIIKSEEIDKSIFTKLPFVIEANFYCCDTEISIQIKNIDGTYHVAQVDVSECDTKTYIGHDIGSDFLVVEAWEDSEKDPLLENMTTKIPTWMAFKGFVKSLKKENND